MKTRFLFVLLLMVLMAAAIPAFAEEELLWTNVNTGSVQSGPRYYSGAPMKKDTEPVLITKVRTYHWNNGNGALAGTISICEDELDNVIGTWQAVGRGENGRQNIFWEALVDCVMYPGHNYFVKVSDKASWSYNAESEGGFYELYGIFPAPEGYADPARYSNSSSSTLRVGQTFTMGRYEQDNNLSNGPELIEWQVLTVQGDRALVISKYALDFRAYNDKVVEITWENCSLRQWLNGYFYNNVFSEAEKNQILLVTNENPDNPQYGTDGGNRTQDRIFALSYDEAQKYFKSDKERICYVTDYAAANYESAMSSVTSNFLRKSELGNTAQWWLRTPGASSLTTVYVPSDGSIYLFGYGPMITINGTAYNEVRPAFWMKTSTSPAATATPQPRTCYKVTYTGNNCLAKVPTDVKCYQIGDLVTVLFEPVEYMQSLIFNGWDMDGDNVADFGYNYPTFAMPGYDVELKAVCYRQYQDHGYSQYGSTDPHQYYNPYNDPTLNNDIYDPNTGWWYAPEYYDGVG